MASPEVLKFGSSVLRSAADIPVAMDEIYRRWREGRQVLAIVSAFEGVTDGLLKEASTLFGSSDPAAIAAYVCVGEKRTAELLSAALNESGIPSRTLTPEEIELLAEGSCLESTPTSVRTSVIQNLWNDFPVLVLPGFYGTNKAGQVVLFGRGGSDVSAIFLASELRAFCRLLTDVEGVFAADPATNPAAHRFTQMSWKSAIDVAGPLIQLKALRLAQIRSQPFDVGRPNEAAHTTVGCEHDHWTPPTEAARPLRIALVGCGVVGRGVYERIQCYKDQFKILHVIVRDTSKHVGVDHLTTDISVTMNPAVDIVIVCIGSRTLTYPVIVATAGAGKYVITSNKTVVASSGDKLLDYSQGEQRRLWYSASVGGALPVLETLAQLKTPVIEMRGTINGTCGSVLQGLGEGQSWNEAVAAAQAAGIAEESPARDLTGRDSADKLVLICGLAFRTWLQAETIPTSGIDSIEGEYAGYQMVARARQTPSGIEASVRPERLPPDSFLGQSRGPENRLEIELSTGEIIRLRGQGAGRWPTAASVLGDLHEVARQIRSFNSLP
jgi:homoserine dehydrogenase